MQCTRPLPLVLYLIIGNVTLLASSPVVQTTSPHRSETLTQLRRDLVLDSPDLAQSKHLKRDFAHLQKPLTFLTDLCHEHEELYHSLLSFLGTLMTCTPGENQDTVQTSLKQFVGTLLQTLPQHAEDLALQKETKRALRSLYQHYTQPHLQQSALAAQKSSSTGEKVLVGLAITTAVVAIVGACFVAWRYSENQKQRNEQQAVVQVVSGPDSQPAASATVGHASPPPSAAPPVSTQLPAQPISLPQPAVASTVAHPQTSALPGLRQASPPAAPVLSLAPPPSPRLSPAPQPPSISAAPLPSPTRSPQSHMASSPPAPPVQPTVSPSPVAQTSLPISHLSPAPGFAPSVHPSSRVLSTAGSPLTAPSPDLGRGVTPTRLFPDELVVASSPPPSATPAGGAPRIFPDLPDPRHEDGGEW